MTGQLPDGASAGWTDFGRRTCPPPFRLGVRGGEHVPLAGVVAIVADHSSTSDGPLVFGALPRRVVFRVEQEMVAGPLGWFPPVVDVPFELPPGKGKQALDVATRQGRDHVAALVAELDFFRNRSVSGEAK